MADLTAELGDLPFSLTEAALTQRIEGRLAAARDRLDQHERAPPGADAASLLSGLDGILRDVLDLAYHCGLVFVTHPEAAVRDAGRRGSEAAERFMSEFRMRRAIYDAVRSADASGLEAAGQHARDKLLREMRRGGVELDAPGRTRLLALSDEIEKLSNQFQQNVNDLVRTVRLDGPAELRGLPADFIRGHPPAEDGSIPLTTRYPDAVPVITYAESAEVRRRMMIEFLLRAYPENLPVLGEVLARRHEYARLLGYATYADYVLEDKMMRDHSSADAFIQRLARLLRPPTEVHLARLLARKRKDDPAATGLDWWDGGNGGGYYETKLREEDFGVDLKLLRDYLPYGPVRDGLLRLCERLFEIEIVAAPTAETWHPTVEAYDVTRHGRPVGRFYLDLVPREGKFSHAAQFTVRVGLADVQLPQAALVCNFLDPKGEKASARLEYSHLITFFHEFGHLLHALFSGHGRWLYNTQGYIEWDFVEAPSQLFEEWARDPDVLATFARHPETGAPIPRDLLDRMEASQGLGRPAAWQFQTALAAASLAYYDRDPASIDAATAFESYVHGILTIPRPPGTHLEASWGHLMGYSACYYTYAWSLVIARDFLGRFLAKGSLVDPELARRYVDTILAPGSSRPAAELVEAFLGRPFSFDAFEAWVLADPYQRRAPAGGA